MSVVNDIHPDLVEDTGKELARLRAINAELVAALEDLAYMIILYDGAEDGGRSLLNRVGAVLAKAKEQV